MNWRHINEAPHNQFVLVARRSGYMCLDWEYVTAQLTAGWHDRWDDVSGDMVEPQPLYWQPLPEAPEGGHMNDEIDLSMWEPELQEVIREQLRRGKELEQELKGLRTANKTIPWQPIETAPLDETVVLLYSPNRSTEPEYIGNYTVGYWSIHYDHWLDVETVELHEPTHWAPVEPPEDT